MTPEDVAAVFNHWRIIMGHQRARMDLARAKVIRARMQDGYSVEDLCIAIDGCAASAFHMGENDRGQIFDSITLILRDADHVDKFIRAGETAHKLLEQREQRKADDAKVLTPPTDEQVAKVRELLKSVKLRRVA